MTVGPEKKNCIIIGFLLFVFKIYSKFQIPKKKILTINMQPNLIIKYNKGKYRHTIIEVGYM